MRFRNNRVASRSLFLVVGVFLMLLIVGQIKSFAQISGATVICPGASYSYSIVGGYSCKWTISGGTIIGSSTSRYVNVQWGSAGGSLSISYRTSIYSQEYISESIEAWPFFGGYTYGVSSVCPSTPFAVNLSGHNSTVLRWEASVNGGASWSTIAGDTYGHSSAGITQNTMFRAVVSTACGINLYSTVTTVSVRSLPAPPSLTSAARCSPGNLVLYSSSTNSKWYSAPSGGSLLATGSVFGTPWLASSTTYYVTTTSAEGCESLRVPVTAFINAPPSQPATPATENLCNGSTRLIISETIPAGITFYWQGTNQYGESTSNSSSSYTVTGQTTTIWLRARNNATGCWSEPRGALVMADPPMPSIPVAGQQYCRNVQVFPSEPLTVSLYEYYWQTSPNGTSISSPAATASTGIVPLTVSQSGTYYIRARNSTGCWSMASSIAVTVRPTLDCLEGQNVNYITENGILIEGIQTESQISSLLVEQVTQSTTYYDGLSRAVQRVVTQGSPLKRDIVQVFSYDAFGRENKKYLPYTGGNDGKFKANAIAEQLNFYQTAVEDPDRIITGMPFSETVFEASSLNKVLEQSYPGETWRVGGGHTSRSATRFNTTGEVRLWLYDFETGVFSAPGFYMPNELVVTELTNENGHKSRSYLNKRGQKILTTTQISAGETAYTYYVYDALSRLRLTIQPEGVKVLTQANDWTLTPDFINNWCFYYSYDGLGRVTERKSPGVAPEWIVYNKRNLPILTQDGNRRLQNQWIFTKYDDLNRIVLTGVYSHPYTATQPEMQQLADAHADQTEQRTSLNFEIQHGYTTDRSFPVLTPSNESILTVTYYDDYDYNNDGSFDRAYLPGMLSQEPPVVSQVIGKITGYKTAILTRDQMLQTVFFYDKWNNIVQSQAHNHKGGGDITTNLFNFAGRLVETKTKHWVSSEVLVTKNFQYDHAGRLLELSHRVNNGPVINLARQRYNELGQLVQKSLHSTDGVNYQQNIDYRYNVRGWLRSINDGVLSEPSDLFGMEFRYNDATEMNSVDRQYNGNISGILYQDRATNRQKAYDFSYYANGSLMNAMHGVKTPSGWDTWNDGNYHEGGILYDLNGNITRLRRSGVGSGGPMQVDDLHYEYVGNQLVTVEDLADDNLSFVDGISAGDDEYMYDANGNMVLDQNKGFTIFYNHKNLAYGVYSRNGGSIHYLYNALGTLLGKMVVDSAGTQTYRSYVDEFEYNNEDQLEYFAHDEGRVVMTGSVPEYQYFMKDHLGNVRLTFTSAPGTSLSVATLETAKSSFEQSQFLYYDEAIRINYPLFDHSRQAPTFYSTRLTGTANERIGLGKSLSVMTGDRVTLEVFVKYLDTNAANWTAALYNFMTSVSTGTAPAGTLVDGGAPGSIGTASFPFAGLLDKGNESGAAPKAYLNYLVFDHQFNLIDGGFVRVSQNARETGTGVPHERLFKELTITKPGFVYAYLSNESDVPVEVYFDDFSVTQVMSSIVQTDSYYPFGERFESFSRENSLFNSKLFNHGSEWQPDLGFNVYFTQLRALDTQLGRWMQPDPLAHKFVKESPYHYAHNNPIRYTDQLGDQSEDNVDAEKNAAKVAITTMRIRKILNEMENATEEEKKRIIKRELRNEILKYGARKVYQELKDEGVIEELEAFLKTTLAEFMAESKVIEPRATFEPSVEHRTEALWEKGISDLKNAMAAVNDGKVTGQDLSNLESAIREMEILMRWRNATQKDLSRRISNLLQRTDGSPVMEAKIRKLQEEFEQKLIQLREVDMKNSSAENRRDQIRNTGR
jgi:RHS repeat-associated protein